MTRVTTLSIAAIAVLALAAPAMADWIDEDGHKMHHPQHPDPNGWDIDVVSDSIYDDWQCSASGPVDDIHLWVSWRGDVPSPIIWVDVAVLSDVPASESETGFSHPDDVMYGNPLWFHRFLPGEWAMGNAETGDQGWLAPSTDVVNPNDHTSYYQMNFMDIPEPFEQEEGTIYWLGVHMGVEDVDTAIGWKTSQEHWNDDAVFFKDTLTGWVELVDPLEPQTSLDMAFVITPEPATLVLLGAGVAGLLVRRRRR